MSCLLRAQLISYFASHAVRAQLPKAQRGLNPPEQGHHIQVFDATPRRGRNGGKVSAAVSASSPGLMHPGRGIPLQKELSTAGPQ